VMKLKEAPSGKAFAPELLAKREDQAGSRMRAALVAYSGRKSIWTSFRSRPSLRITLRRSWYDGPQGVLDEKSSPGSADTRNLQPVRSGGRPGPLAPESSGPDAGVKAERLRHRHCHPTGMRTGRGVDEKGNFVDSHRIFSLLLK